MQRRQPRSAMSVQSDCLMDDNMAGSEKKPGFKSLAASHLANLPKYIAVKLHWIVTFFCISCYQDSLFIF